MLFFDCRYKKLSELTKFYRRYYKNNFGVFLVHSVVYRLAYIVVRDVRGCVSLTGTQRAT